MARHRGFLFPRAWWRATEWLRVSIVAMLLAILVPWEWLSPRLRVIALVWIGAAVICIFWNACTIERRLPLRRSLARRVILCPDCGHHFCEIGDDRDRIECTECGYVSDARGAIALWNRVGRFKHQYKRVLKKESREG